MSDALAVALASRVMAATEKVVSQAMDGAWSEVPRTLEQRRALLDELSAQATPADQAWLMALQQAVAESDSAVQSMVAQPAPAATGSESPQGDSLHLALRRSLLSKDD